MSVSDEPGLGGLGVSNVEQAVYEVLLRHPDVTLVDLIKLTPFGRDRLLTVLKSLADKGMLTSTGGRPAVFSPAPPDLAVEVLALQRQQEIDRARLAGAVLSTRTGNESWLVPDPPVQVVRGPEAVAHRFRQVQRLARKEVLILDKPPYAVEPDGAQHLLRRELQDRGVRYRTIYHRDALGPEGRADELRRLAAYGELARVLADVPLRLVVADRRIGLVPHEAASDGQTLLLRSSTLLDGLVTLFEALWERAVPLWPSTGRTFSDRDKTAAPTGDDLQLLTLLAAGLTDQAIARKLGVARRTAERRVRRLMDGFGAQTRFQAGLQAAMRGLFRGEEDREGTPARPGRRGYVG